MLDFSAPEIKAEEFAARREAMARRIGDDAALLVATHEEALHSNDVHHRFRPHSDFWYLTGFAEPNSVLVLEGGSGASHLFLNERDPKQEIWTGRRLGVDRAVDEVGIDHAHSIEDFGPRLGDILGSNAAHVVTTHNRKISELVANAIGESSDGREHTSEARCIKSKTEIEMLQTANDVGIAGHLASYPVMQEGNNERQVEAAFVKTIRDRGSEGVGYPPIVGAGANASVLHYIDNSATIGDGDLVLIDAGCEWGFYNSDITRTVPASGEWSSRQLDLYDVVLRAQDNAIKAARPGNKLRDPHVAAVETLVDGLVELNVLSGDPQKIIEANEHDQFYMHGTSHFLGLDVHDSGRTKDEDGESRTLEEGMVITVEPGLYFNPDYAKLPEGTDPLGIRIENDVVITADGCMDMTRSLTRDPNELAALASS